MIAVDASVLIAYLSRDDSHHGAAKDVVAHERTFVVHTVNLAEVLVGAERVGRTVESLSRIRAIGVREAERVADEALRLAGLRVQTGLRLPDCCALLAAEANGADLATFDTRLAESARSHGLTVIEP